MLKTPGATAKQVKDVVNKGADVAMGAETSATPVSTPGQGGKMEEVEGEGEVVAEEEATEEEVVSEEETATETEAEARLLQKKKLLKRKSSKAKNSILQLKKMLTHFFLAMKNFPKHSEKRQN